jgi:hypothetical protein
MIRRQMGRSKRTSHQASPIYAVKETVAALNEELELTLNYAEALTRDRSFRAAAEVIEEQRRSLAKATARMEQAVASTDHQTHRPRVRIALAGIAAAMAIASSALAAFGPAAQHPDSNAKIEAIHQASDALTAATAITDPVALVAIVSDAQQTLLDVAQAAPTDPRLRGPLLDTLEKLQRFVRNRHVPATVREQAQKVAETVKQIVVEVPESSETTDSTQTTQTTETTEPAATETTPSAPTSTSE